ncbi:EGF-like and EMI domain-containing protein 1 isoform X2 [Saccostrea cucullata]|uniref:EGF-like and EMI domain-containing protein 1 isoform X2 n=1 Tax=Saccostrea cuccullata TaxID=36930 RepID=UPI002ED459B2
MLTCFLWFIFARVQEIQSLSGHVCKREKAETYMTSYNQAFLCQERYTTSCGHLDWRRCTRYRVQTCYTPRERYAIRYHVVETCCPGWSDDGTGACAIANCRGVCQNEGRCSDVAGTPTCVCQEGYYGDNCQHERNSWEGWQTTVLCSCGILVVVITAITVCVFLRYRRKVYNMLNSYTGRVTDKVTQKTRSPVKILLAALL